MRSESDDWETHVWRVDQYQGQPHLSLAATQLEGSRSGITRSEANEILQQWIRFFASGPTQILKLDLRSRVPQQLLNSLAGQVQLNHLELKWGNYSDLSALGGMRDLRSLWLGGASKVTTLDMLTSLPELDRLGLDQTYLIGDLRLMGQLTSLRSLTYGNSSMGSDKSVVIPSLSWVRQLNGLTELRLPGTRLIDTDLTALLELPNLVTLGLPLRRSYRKQVFEFATHSAIFAAVAERYEGLDEYHARMKAP